MSDSVIKVLLIEDNPMDALLIKSMLSKSQFTTFDLDNTTQLTTGISLITQNSYDVILLDLYLPDSRGIDTFETIFSQKPEMPIVVLTGLDDELIALQAVNNGAQDYLNKGNVDTNLLSRALRYAIERKKAENKIKYLALYDSLTDLPNRRLFFDRLTHAFSRAFRYRHVIALLYIDLDEFKPINDNYGHEVGDKVLKETADRIKMSIRKTDTAARIGGDEFAVILQDVDISQNSVLVAEKIVKSITIPFKINELKCSIGASIGISVYPSDGDDAKTLLKRADMAMYHVKNKGKSGYSFYNSDIEKEYKEMTYCKKLR